VQNKFVLAALHPRPLEPIVAGTVIVAPFAAYPVTLKGIGVPAILPFGLAILVTTQWISRLVGKVDLKVRGLIGLGIVAVAIGLLTQLDAQSNYWTQMLPEITLLGIGVGLAIVPFNMVVLSTSDPADAGVTAGVLQASLTLGGCIGLALLLLPYSSGGVASMFKWGFVITIIGLLVTVGFWFGPGARKSTNISHRAISSE